MHLELFDILRCPYCGGRLELVTSLPHRAASDRIHDGILGCHCCIFPVVDGIPVLHLQPSAITAREHVEAGRFPLALRTMIGVDDAAQAEQFEATAANAQSTYRDVVAAMGPNFEGGYFLYRFSDPTFIVANAVVRAVASTVLHGTRRAIDICGGSGHLTRSLMDLSTPAPVLADLFFPKVWLARRFTAPGCAPVCCDGNAPMPFVKGAFGYAMCSDAFQYIWTKRQFVGEMSRLVDDAKAGGAIVINHTHNQLTWSPSHGQPLAPAGYRDLFEQLTPHIYGEAGLFGDVVDHGRVDLSRADSEDALNSDPALTLVASANDAVFRAHAVTKPEGLEREFRINPLYAIEQRGDTAELTLTFPDSAYEDEYGACRRYLPERASVRLADLDALARGERPSAATDLLERRVILELPVNYY
ncbi:MAG: hypothetical protein LBQ09_04880 [Acidobacteriaceae bacterium]|jgi:uncharacterized protein YbaR (Trm112 family)|nr:hypothetical protein [Acidobacteriaceae bacterium]